MDDILIAETMSQEIEVRTKMVLQKFVDNDLYCKIEKCEFDKTEVKYLGFIVKENKIKMDPVRLQRIKE